MRGTQQTAAPAPASGATREQIREQVRQTIQDANEAARDAAQAARDAGQAARDVRSSLPVIPPVPPVPPIPSFPAFPGGGFTVQDVGGGPSGIPSQVVDISLAFFVTCAVMVIGWPISRAFGKRIERRAATAVGLDTASTEQLQRIERAVDAMSIEIERISESQRFMARLQDANSAEGQVRGLKLPG